MSEDIDRLLDKIETLEQENARLKARVVELEKLSQPVGRGNEAEDEANAE